MSEQSNYYENYCLAGAFAREDADECGCRGSGWFLSEVDTWHECPAHHVAGQRHPDDEDVFEGPAEAVARVAPVAVAVVEDDDIQF